MAIQRKRGKTMGKAKRKSNSAGQVKNVKKPVNNIKKITKAKDLKKKTKRVGR